MTKAEILEGCTKGLIAARIADTYTLNGYDDWFLPSKNELNEMWLREEVGKLELHGWHSYGYELFEDGYETCRKREATALVPRRPCLFS